MSTTKHTNLLVKEKHDLVRQFENKEIEEELYNQKLIEVNNKINIETRIRINEKSVTAW